MLFVYYVLLARIVIWSILNWTPFYIISTINENMGFRKIIR